MTRTGKSLPWCSSIESAYLIGLEPADLKDLKPVSGFAKGQPAPAVQPIKPTTPQMLVNNAAITIASEVPQQPMQQLQQSAPVVYERNSLAIKLSNNPLASLVDLQEAVGSVLDEPVSFAACQHNHAT